MHICGGSCELAIPLLSQHTSGTPLSATAATQPNRRRSRSTPGQRAPRWLSLPDQASQGLSRGGTSCRNTLDAWVSVTGRLAAVPLRTDTQCGGWRQLVLTAAVGGGGLPVGPQAARAIRHHARCGGTVRSCGLAGWPAAANLTNMLSRAGLSFKLVRQTHWAPAASSLPAFVPPVLLLLPPRLKQSPGQAPAIAAQLPHALPWQQMTTADMAEVYKPQNIVVTGGAGK